MLTEILFIGIIVPIMLAALAIMASGGSLIISGILCALALTITIYWIIRSILRRPKIRMAFSHNDAEAAFHEIYKLAAQYGGTLMASHISPLERVTRPDDVPDLLAKVTQPLDYHRLLFIDDPILLDKWIRQTLKLANNKIKVTIAYSTITNLISPLVWRVIPRINLIP